MVSKPLWLLLAALFTSASALATPPSGIDTSQFDPGVRMQDDLFYAVNGHWLATTPIPADQASWGAFNQLRDLSEARSRTLIEQAVVNRASSADMQKIGDLYRSFMNAAALDQLGSRPLDGDLAQINGIRNLPALTRYLGERLSTPIGLPLTLSVDPDARNASVTLLQVNQSGLGMPDRDYYLKDDPRFSAARQAYCSYLETLFTLAGRTAPQARASAVIDLETRLARAQWSNVDNRDPQKTYNKLSRAALMRLTPGLDWNLLLAGAGLSSVRMLNLTQPDYATQLGVLLRTVPIQIWRDYLTARLLDSYAPLLSKPFTDADFAFHQQALSGVQSPKPRWKRGVALVERSMGMALGKRYVSQYFPAPDRDRVNRLVGNLLLAFRQSIDTLDWMTPATREQAQAKLAKYHVKIGYPDKWRDYSTLSIRADDLIGNVKRVSLFQYRYMLNKLGKPVDRDEWQMTPQTVNAYYDPQKNEIVFPAAILQPPFFNANADDAVNYGGIGAVIGHEISHGFDDQGSQFDGEGNLRNWWSAEDRQRFTALTDRLVAQYGAYQPLPGHAINGRLTLGENIADNAGLQIAYKAYHLSLNGHSAPVIDGLSGDQRFFIGYAQVWRSKMQDAQTLKLLVTDPHSPGRFRTNGAVVNADGFYQAFGVHPGDKLYKPESERIRLW
jgi:putative endopeptidase